MGQLCRRPAEPGAAASINAGGAEVRPRGQSFAGSGRTSGRWATGDLERRGRRGRRWPGEQSQASTSRTCARHQRQRRVRRQHAARRLMDAFHAPHAPTAENIAQSGDPPDEQDKFAPPSKQGRRARSRAAVQDESSRSPSSREGRHGRRHRRVPRVGATAKHSASCAPHSIEGNVTAATRGDQRGAARRPVSATRPAPRPHPSGTDRSWAQDGVTRRHGH